MEDCGGAEELGVVVVQAADELAKEGISVEVSFDGVEFMKEC